MKEQCMNDHYLKKLCRKNSSLALCNSVDSTIQLNMILLFFHKLLSLHFLYSWFSQSLQTLLQVDQYCCYIIALIFHGVGATRAVFAHGKFLTLLRGPFVVGVGIEQVLLPIRPEHYTHPPPSYYLSGSRTKCFKQKRNISS